MLFRNLLVRHPNPQHPLYTYHHGPIYTNGAQEMVFNKVWAYPVVVMKGAGQVAGQFRSMQPPQLRTLLALTPATYVGAGQPAGSIRHQPLIDTGEDSNAPTIAMQ